ncbi:MAG TPA: alpha/beta hydrolase-fold protein [Anaerolineales bacterium]|nr:alpha/beta hydrolase-fold protein [Anaerolineales bacterium]
MPAKPATILGSELHTLRSKDTGKPYRITIGLPFEYYDKPSKKWPVIYLVDGNWYFGMVTDMVRVMALCETTTDAIVVGIGYPNNKKKKRFHEDVFRRDFDLTPIANEKFEKEDGDFINRKVNTGGVNKFINLIQHELMPFVNKKYRVSPGKRVLVGHSFGGLFAAYALLEKPRLFTHYLVCSPSLWWHDQYMFDREKDFAKRHRQLKANVYLSAGDLEENANSGMASNTLRFSAILQSRSYKGLNIVQEIFNAKKHCEVVAPSYQAGLKWALKK